MGSWLCSSNVYLYLGSSTGLGVGQLVVAGVSAPVGIPIAGAGDVNGDGFGDVLIGGTHAASLYLGSATGLPNAPSVLLTGPPAVPTDRFGPYIATPGDINGDGYADAIVFDPDWGAGLGAMSVFLGSVTGLAATTQETYTARSFIAPINAVGGPAAGIGDANGDGYADWFVYNQTDSAIGFMGGADGYAHPAGTVWTGGPGVGFSAVYSGAGDVSGLGRNGFVVGVPSTGSAYICAGVCNPVSVAGASGSGFGASVAFRDRISGQGGLDRIANVFAPESPCVEPWRLWAPSAHARRFNGRHSAVSESLGSGLSGLL